jgi:hypothetical protein
MRANPRCGESFHTLRTEEKAGFLNHDDNRQGTVRLAQPIEKTKIKKTMLELCCVKALKETRRVRWG